MSKQIKTKQNVHHNKKNKSKEHKIVENYHNNLHSQSFPPPKPAKTAKSAPASPDTTDHLKAMYVDRISCSTRRNFYEQGPGGTNITSKTRKKTIVMPHSPSPPQNVRRAFPLIEGDKNIYKQKRNAKGVYFSKVEKPEPTTNQAKYNTWKVKKVENRAMNTKPQVMSYVRHRQREEEKRRRALQEDVIRTGKLLHPKNSLIETQEDPHNRSLTLTETMHVDIKPNYNLPNSPFGNRSPLKPITYSSDKNVYY